MILEGLPNSSPWSLKTTASTDLSLSNLKCFCSKLCCYFYAPLRRKDQPEEKAVIDRKLRLRTRRNPTCRSGMPGAHLCSRWHEGCGERGMHGREHTSGNRHHQLAPRKPGVQHSPRATNLREKSKESVPDW